MQFIVVVVNLLLRWWFSSFFSYSSSSLIKTFVYYFFVVAFIKIDRSLLAVTVVVCFIKEQINGKEKKSYQC